VVFADTMWLMGRLFRRSKPTGTAPVAGCPGYLSPYRAAVDQMGSCFESLLWTSPETQRLRFQAITTSIDLSNAVVLDAGCGRADLAAWMASQSIKWRRYIGVDAIPEMVAHGRNLSLADAEFHLVDFVTDEGAFLCAGERPEVIVFSGSLNTIPPSVSVRALQRAWRSCTRALVFNFLSADNAPRGLENPAGRAQKLSPSAVARWALRRTRDFSLRHDYLEGRDATIVMLKSGDRRAPGARGARG
jgi:SAM-dependent methyltransferase